MSSPSPAPDSDRGRVPGPDSAVPPDQGPPDAIVLLSFGGPEGPDEVMPFLRQVTAGRGIPDTRLEQVAEHYLARGGVSPINAENRALVEALTRALSARGLSVPVLWGNRNWRPWLADTFAEALAAGHRRLTVVTTSAYPSGPGCHRYGLDVQAALATADPGGRLQVTRVRPYYDQPWFRQATTDCLRRAVAAIDPTIPADRTRILAITHSLPLDADAASGPPAGTGYVAAHQAVLADALTGLSRRIEADLVYCSRSGRPGQPWLEPDVVDRLEELAAAPDVPAAVVLAPIGFISDHMEVVHDIDTEAVAAARRLGLAWVRADTVGREPVFVQGLLNLALSSPAPCPANCCRPKETA